MNKLEEMCRAHFNEPMILGFETVRCVGYGETAVDCYIIVQHPRGKISWATCVGGYVFLDKLKGQNHVVSTGRENWDDFTRLDSALAMNGCPKAKEFKLELRLEDMEGKGLYR